VDAVEEWLWMETVMQEGTAVKKLRVGQVLKVKADLLAASGAGVVADHVPSPLHVRDLLPSEEATVVIQHVSRHGGPAHAVVQRRYSCAQERVVPSCASFGPCGGCAVLHLTYSAQLAWKGRTVCDELAPLSLDVKPCVAAPSPADYRSRVKLVATSHPLRKVLLGAFAPRSHTVLDMAGCQTNRRTLMAVAKTVAEQAALLGIPSYDEATAEGALRYVLLREVDSGAVQVSLVMAERPPQLSALVDAVVRHHDCVKSVVLHKNAIRGNALLPLPGGASSQVTPVSHLDDDQVMGDVDGDEVLLGEAFLWEDLTMRLRVSARSFLQVNREVARLIYREVAQVLRPVEFDTVLDLYCGVSGLGRSVLADHPAARLIGIEVGATAIADARASAQAAALPPERASFHIGKVEEVLTQLASERPALGRVVALLNPPRRGCSEEALTALVAMAPSHILYMSCSPHSLGRDLKWLHEHGYATKQVTPYDMHPGTPHIECVAELVRQ
jgi:23S rRNA (uracil1939-C5)-methyltransferase